MASKTKPTARTKAASTRRHVRQSSLPAAPPPTTNKQNRKTSSIPKPSRQSKRSGLSLLDAAAQILNERQTPMTCKAIVEAVTSAGLWSSPAGKTPHNTLYAAMLREINTKGEAARFTKTDRGHFTSTTINK